MVGLTDSHLADVSSIYMASPAENVFLLINELAAHMGYNPIRARVPDLGHSLSLQVLKQKTIPEQIATYEGLLSSQIVDDKDLQDSVRKLASILRTGHEATLKEHAYQEASAAFYQAFQLDPHNFYFYRLAILLGQAAQLAPDALEQFCINCMGQDIYAFAAAQHYLQEIGARITAAIKEAIEHIRGGRLGKAKDSIETIKEQLPTSKAIECAWLVCECYWELYNYRGVETRGVSDRIQTAIKSRDAAQEIYVDNQLQEKTSARELAEELEIEWSLLQGYELLFRQGFGCLEKVEKEIASLHYSGEHAFVNRLKTKELPSLKQWKAHYQRVCAYCLESKYSQALEYLQDLSESDNDWLAFGWLNPEDTPNKAAWQSFCNTCQHGVDRWLKYQQQYEYQTAQTAFAVALKKLPVYIEGQPSEPLRQSLENITALLADLSEKINTGTEMLMAADRFKDYQFLPDKLREAQKDEEKLLGMLGGKSSLPILVQRADQFVEDMKKGDLRRWKELLDSNERNHDPLFAGYKRIVEIISAGAQPDASPRAVGIALNLAPENSRLIFREVSLVLGQIRQGRLEESEETLNLLRLDSWWLTCLRQLCQRYKPLARVLSENPSFLPKTDIEQINVLSEIPWTDEAIDLPDLLQEIEIFNRLAEMYKLLQQQGLESLTEAEKKLYIQLADHIFLEQGQTMLSSLHGWAQRRDLAYHALRYQRYTELWNILRQTPHVEKLAVAWLKDEPQVLEKFTEIVTGLEKFKNTVEANLQMLRTAMDFETYQPVYTNLKQNSGNLQGALEWLIDVAPYIDQMIERADHFVGYAQNGQIEELQRLIEQGKDQNDNFVIEYERIAKIINTGLQETSSFELAQQAFNLAPGSTKLNRKIVLKILELIRQGEVAEAAKKLQALSPAQKNQPPFQCLKQLCIYYGNLDARRSLTADERLEVIKPVRKGDYQPCLPSDWPELEQEFNTLKGLVEIYHVLNEQGLEGLPAVQPIWDGLIRPERHHAFIEQFRSNLEGLKNWKTRRESWTEKLMSYRYDDVLKELDGITEIEKSALAWLKGAHQPNWEAWRTFCSEAQSSVELWQTGQYDEAEHKLLQLSKTRPIVMSNRVQEAVENMASDAKDLQRIVEKAMLDRDVTAKTLDQVSELLSIGAEIERKYPFGRYMQKWLDFHLKFAELAKRADAAELAKLIEQAEQ